MKRVILLMVLLCATALMATVPNVPYTVTYTCVGGYGPFAFTFPISDPTALTVTLNGVLLTSSDYTVTPTNNNYSNGGSVTLDGSFPCTAGQLNILTRSTPITQTIKFYDNMPAPMSNVERGLDKLTEIDQEIWGRTTHSIQMQNNGVNYLSPATGDITFNYINCIISGPQNDFAITCPTTTSGGSGTGGHYVGWAGTGSTTQLSTVNVIYVGGSSPYSCDDVGINAANTDMTALGYGVIDARGCTGTLSAANTITVTGNQLLLGYANWTMSGVPNVDISGDGAAVIGPTSTPLRKVQIINNTVSGNSITVHDSLGFEIAGLDIENAVGITRTDAGYASPNSRGAGIYAAPSTQPCGHGHVHDMTINGAPYGILEDNGTCSLGLVENSIFEGYAPINTQGLIAGIKLLIADDTDLFNGVTLASQQFRGIGMNDIVGGAPTEAMISVGNGVDTLEMTDVDIGHVGGTTPFIGFLMTDQYGINHPGSGGRAPRFNRCVNCSIEGNGAPAIQINGARQTRFVNWSAASGSQPTTPDHTLVIDNTGGGNIWGLSFVNGSVGSGSAKEAVYLHDDPLTASIFSDIKFIGNTIGDSSQGSPGTYCHVLIDSDINDVLFDSNAFRNVFGNPVVPLCSIKVASGAGDRTVITNNITEGVPDGIINLSTGENIVEFGNIGAGSNNNIYTGTGFVQFNVPGLKVGGAGYSGVMSFVNPAGASATIGMHSSQTANSQFFMPITNCSSGTVWEWQGTSNPAICTTASMTINGILCSLGGSCDTASGTITGLTVNNAADATLQTYLQSGSTTDQITNFSFRDYLGNVQWQLRKTAANLFQVNDGTNPFIGLQTSGCCSTINSQFSTANPLNINGSANASTGGLRVMTGGASPNPATTIGGDMTIRQIGVAFTALSAGLGSTADGFASVYCTDCKVTTPATCSTATPAACACTSGGGGAWAKYYNFEGAGANWYCQ